MSVLILIEHDNQKLQAASLNTITAGLKIAEKVDAIILGNNCDSVIKEVSGITGINKIFYANNARFAHPVAEDICFALKKIASNYTHILAPASTFGKNCLHRLGADLDVQPISDIVEIKNENTFVRPIYAGNAFVTLQSKDTIKVITVRPTAFEPAKTGENTAEKENVEFELPEIKTQYINQTMSNGGRPELGAAKIIISGGRGLQGAEQFQIIEKLADRLGAAVGASRAAVDAGFVPNDYQVGQTGKVVAPDLYIAIGISGAIQHVAGIKDSKIIVAINKDPDAPIFEIADYGLVADFFEILPELEAGLEKLGY